jgi:putative ABC transport system substrate-binding protein
MGIQDLFRGLRLATWATVLTLAGTSGGHAGTMEIAIVSSRDIAPYRAAYEGFIEVLDEAGVRYRTVEYRTEKDRSKSSQVVKKIHRSRPDLILTIGSAATDAVAGEIGDIPIIFSLVLDGGSEGSQESRGQNVTGASMDIPVQVQFEKIHAALPAARRFGVLYNPGRTGKLIEDARLVADELDLELVPIAVRDEAEVVDRIAGLDGKIDLLWSVADPTVFTPQSVRYILLNMLRSRIPFIGLSPSYVRAGALLSLSCDYRDVGRQAGEQALQILQVSKPQQIPMTYPRTVSTYLNLNTEKTLKLKVADAVRESAEVVSDS